MVLIADARRPREGISFTQFLEQFAPDENIERWRGSDVLPATLRPLFHRARIHRETAGAICLREDDERLVNEPSRFLSKVGEEARLS